MRVPAAVVAIGLLAAPRPSLASVEVRVAGEAVDVQATNAPLAEILERLGRQTQMRVLYDGVPPRQAISIDLRGRTVVEAVTAALEGQGINYALAMDPTGTRVETLFVSGSATSVRSADNMDRRPPMREMPPEPVLEEPEPVPEEDNQPPPDSTAGLNAQQGQPGGKEGLPPQQEAPVAVPMPGQTWSSSPFAPAAPPPAQPTPQATPPPFNP